MKQSFSSSTGTFPTLFHLGLKKQYLSGFPNPGRLRRRQEGYAGLSKYVGAARVLGKGLPITARCLSPLHSGQKRDEAQPNQFPQENQLSSLEIPVMEKKIRDTKKKPEVEVIIF